MARPFRYSWSFHKDFFHTCRKKGWLSYILRKDPEVPEDKFNAVPGITVAAVTERIYNEELWRLREGLRAHILNGPKSVLQQEWDRALNRNRVDWSKERWVYAESTHRSVSPQEIFTEVKEMMGLTLDSIREHKLLGSYARAEVKLTTRLGKYTLYGKVDLILRRKDTGLTFLDGKTSRHREVYTHKDQLNFYALMYLMMTGKLPDRLMFLYNRFSGDLAAEAFPVNKADLKRLRDEVVASMLHIERGEFEANPVAKHCKFCAYEPECEERQAQKVANAAKRRKASDENAQELGIESGSLTSLDF